MGQGYANRPSQSNMEYVTDSHGKRVINRAFKAKRKPSQKANYSAITSITHTNFTIPKRTIKSPKGYGGVMTRKEKIESGKEIADIVRGMGYDVATASITGSVLKGLDHEESDMDFLVLVGDKIKPFAFTGDNDEYEGQVVPLEKFRDNVSRSVPFMEFLMSPFRVTTDKYEPVFTSIRPSMTEFKYHADKSVMHNLSRESVSEDKAGRAVLSTFLFRDTGNPLMPRTVFDNTHPRRFEAAEWAEGVYNIRDAEMSDHARRSIDYLRG